MQVMLAAAVDVSLPIFDRQDKNEPPSAKPAKNNAATGQAKRKPEKGA
jgi:hypothetical protein